MKSVGPHDSAFHGSRSYGYVSSAGLECDLATAIDLAWATRMAEYYPVASLRQATSVTFVPAAIGKVLS